MGQEGELGLIRRFLATKGRAKADFVAVRMFRSGHHYYTILASDSGFEYVFRNGRKNWSTISQSFAKRLIEKNRQGVIGTEIALNKKQFLKLATGITNHSTSDWLPSSEIYYQDRALAIATERRILDNSWEKLEDNLDA